MQKTMLIALLFATFNAVAQPPSSPFNTTKGTAPTAPPPQGSSQKTAASTPIATQPTPKSTSKPTISIYEKEFQERIKKTEINGVYIPKDLVDALDQLDKLIGDESKAKFKTHTEDEAVHKLYFSLGRWIWTNWSLLDGSRLSEFFREYGIHHPEDIAVVIIRSYHRRLNGKELNLKQQMAELKLQYSKEDAARKAKSFQQAEKQDGKDYLTKEEMEAKKKAH